VIGSQTWFQRNLDYAVAGSKCGNDSKLSDMNTATCDTYGRLYSWATAMNLPASCNSSSCSSQINTPHQGICPSGWHIPSNAEWSVLINFVGSSSAYVLKATNGWNNHGNGGDKYGFAALPNGFGNFVGVFYSVGDQGRWWSATEYNAENAYHRVIYYNYVDVDERYDTYKSYLFGIRCLKDD